MSHKNLKNNGSGHMKKVIFQGFLVILDLLLQRAAAKAVAKKRKSHMFRRKK